MSKKQKIQKTTIQSSAARAAISAAADSLEPHAGSDGQVAAAIEKLRALVDGPVVGVGDGAKTEISDFSSPIDESVAKSLEQMETLRKQELAPAVRERVQSVSRRLQEAYLRKMSPAAADALEARTEVVRKSNEAQHAGRQVPVIGDDAEIRKAAEKLRKADPRALGLRGARARIPGEPCRLRIQTVLLLRGPVSLPECAGTAWVVRPVRPSVDLGSCWSLRPGSTGNLPQRALAQDGCHWVASALVARHVTSARPKLVSRRRVPLLRAPGGTRALVHPWVKPS